MVSQSSEYLRITMTVTPEEADELQKFAESKRMSLRELLTCVVREYLANPREDIGKLETKISVNLRVNLDLSEDEKGKIELYAGKQGISKPNFMLLLLREYIRTH